MFTGIIEETGTLIKAVHAAGKCVYTFSAQKILEDMHIGDSIAVNGLCLTVTSFSGKTFSADVTDESLRRSSFSYLSVGTAVNLERAMAANGRFGGHMVLGHVDGTGVFQSSRKEDNALIITVRVPAALMHYIVEKGSVAVDGISLTVAAVTADTFSVSVIPHTLAETSLIKKKSGDILNIECDIIGKYVEKFMSENDEPGGLTEELLERYGFTEGKNV